MDRNCEDKYGVRSPKGSKSGFHEDDSEMKSDSDTPTLQSPGFSEQKDLECSRMCLKDSELSSTDDLSGKEKTCLISSCGPSNPLAFDLKVHIQETPVGLKRPFQNIPNPLVRDICSSDGLPVCTQLPVNHQDSHTTVFKATHRHRILRHSSTSSTKTWRSLRAPAEDLCASFLLACLFCKFWDCVLAIGDGCQYCVSSICSSFCSKACCCDPLSLEGFMDFCPCCGCTEYMEACGCSCRGPALDCSVCDLCLQTTECLELGMELSQLLFH